VAARAILWAGFVGVLASVALLVSLDLDISPYRYLRNDVLFRGAPSIQAIYSYPTMDPSPFSVALPADLFVRESLHRGELPLWDRMQGGGYSLVAQGNLGVMFPLRWLTAPLPPHQAQSAFLLLSLYLCFAGALLWLADLGLSGGAAAFGAGLYAFSGLMLCLALFDGVAVFLFLPWLLLCYRRWERHRSYGRFAALVIAFALSFTSGHHMLLAAVFLGVALVAVLDFLLARRDWRSLAGLGTASVWGAFTASFVLLPFCLHLQGSWKYKTQTVQGRSYAVPDLPGWIHGLIRAVLDGRPFLLDTPDFYQYLGFPAVALALIGCFAARRQPTLRFLPPALVLSFLLCLPGPWMGFLAGLPPFAFIRMFYLYVIFLVVVAAAAAAGFDWLRLRGASRVPGLVFAIAALAIVGANALRGLHVFAPVPAEPIPESDAYRLLRADGDTFRITGLGGQCHLPNISHLTGLEDLRVISVVMNPRYHAWFELVDPAVMTKTYPTSRVTNELSSPLVGAFNVKYVVAGKVPHHVYLTQIRPGDIFSRYSPQALPVSRANLEAFYEDRVMQVLRVVNSYRPRAFLAERVHAVPPGMEHAAAWIRAHPEALIDSVVAEAASETLREALETHAGPAGSVELEYPSQRSVRLRTRSERPALLVLNDIFEAGWEAQLDGAPAEILPVNLIARGVWVPEGDHEVRMRYRPPGFAAGVALSGMSLAALGLGGLAARRRRKSA